MWYTIAWFGEDGKSVKMEILHRKSVRKMHEFVYGRIHRNNLPEGAYGFWIRRSTPEEQIDHDINELRSPSNAAEDLGVGDDAPFVYEDYTMKPELISDR